MSQPALAASITWIGFLILAAIISVGISWILKISAISSIRIIPFVPMSSSLPRNGLTYVAPALAARSACADEKIRVTLVLIPRAVSF